MFRAGTRTIFVHGFAKNEKDNIEKGRIGRVEKLAAELLGYDDKTLAGASQAVFARYLNVTAGLVSQWERGEKHPQGASLKLLSLVAKNGLQAVA